MSDEELSIAEVESEGSRSDINLLLSDTNIKYVKSSSLGNKARRLVGIRSYMTKTEFESQTNNLYKCCLKAVRDLHELHRRRMVGMKIIDDIVYRCDPEYITVRHVIHIVWSMMSCIHHFQLRLRTGHFGLIQYVRRKKTKKCSELYMKLIRMFKPIMHRIILNSIITFYKEGKLWEIEFAITDLVMRLLNVYEDAEEAVNDILSAAEKASLSHEVEAKHLIQVLYQLLRQIKWRTMSERLMLRMLTMLKCSIAPSEADPFNYAPLRRGIELCIKNAISNLQSTDLMNMLSATIATIADGIMDDESLLDFGNLAAFAARRYKVKTFYQKVKPGLLETMFALTKSKKSIPVFVWARIWLNLIDRNNNAAVLRAPRIYFQGCDYGIVMKKCSHKDRLFMKNLRRNIYEVELDSFSYAFKPCELEAVFQACAVTLVELPCGYSASPHIAIAMCLQDYAFEISKKDLIRSHHLHAMVMSLITLVCYIHNAEVLYEYVNKIMERRAEWAPHLNPPLKPVYQYAQHHVLWNKPDLFFEDWEVRYGLWKCFRLKRKQKK